MKNIFNVTTILLSNLFAKLLYVATTFFVSAENITTFTFWSTVIRPFFDILQIGDIYRIFYKLQHSLARLQHRYYDVTVLMGW